MKYAKSISENYPEVYNYSVSISLLPLNFERGADLKPPHLEEQPTTSIENRKKKREIRRETRKEKRKSRKGKSFLKKKNRR